MKDALILEHKTYISARRAAEITGYTSDYIGQLCRGGKIESKIVGRAWFVLEESLLKHKEINDLVKTNKKTAKKRRALQAQAEIQAQKNNFPVIPGINFISKDEIEVGNFLLPERTTVQTAQTTPIVSTTSIIPEISVAPKKEISKPQPSSFRYEPVASPLIPLLRKTVEVQEARRKEKEISVKFVPAIFSIKEAVMKAPKISSEISRASRSRSAKISTARSFSGNTIAHNANMNFAAVVILLALVVGGGFFVMQPSLSKFASTSSHEASLVSVSKDILSSIARGWRGVSEKVASVFGIDGDEKKTSHVAVNAPSPSSEQKSEDLGFNGIAVVPSTNSIEKDEAIKDRIRASFSDEVSVHPDKSGTAGVITPVFKKATGDDFVYVLVPIQETIQ